MSHHIPLPAPAPLEGEKKKKHVTAPAVPERRLEPLPPLRELMPKPDRNTTYRSLTTRKPTIVRSALDDPTVALRSDFGIGTAGYFATPVFEPKPQLTEKEVREQREMQKIRNSYEKYYTYMISKPNSGPMPASTVKPHGVEALRDHKLTALEVTKLAVDPSVAQRRIVPPPLPSLSPRGNKGGGVSTSSPNPISPATNSERQGSLVGDQPISPNAASGLLLRGVVPKMISKPIKVLKPTPPNKCRKSIITLTDDGVPQLVIRDFALQGSPQAAEPGLAQSARASGLDNSRSALEPQTAR